LVIHAASLLNKEGKNSGVISYIIYLTDAGKIGFHDIWYWLNVWISIGEVCELGTFVNGILIGDNVLNTTTSW